MHLALRHVAHTHFIIAGDLLAAGATITCCSMHARLCISMLTSWLPSRGLCSTILNSSCCVHEAHHPHLFCLALLSCMCMSLAALWTCAGKQVRWGLYCSLEECRLHCVFSSSSRQVRQFCSDEARKHATVAAPNSMLRVMITRLFLFQFAPFNFVALHRFWYCD